MYIAITRKKYKDTYHQQILLRESYREDGKVKTRTLLNLTNQPKAQVEAIAAALKNRDDIVVTSSNQAQGKTIGLSLVIIFLMKMLGIIKAIGKSYEAKIALMLIAARIVVQSSRLQALFWAKEEDKILDLLDFSSEEQLRLNNKNIFRIRLYSRKSREDRKLFFLIFFDPLFWKKLTHPKSKILISFVADYANKKQRKKGDDKYG